MSIHFGADYYPEHWPKERWERDAQLMQQMGLKVVRMAEFSWHKMEPEEGVFDFAWLDEAIALLAKYDIKTILGTPTAAPPAWLVNRYPQILPVDRFKHVHGFGGRHHDCQSNPDYRRLCLELVTAMAEHFKNNPNVIGWQIDNELGNSHYDFCHCDSCRNSFQNWLKKKYNNIETLNEKWGTAFWSQEYNDFGEIFTPALTAAGENPSMMLDWNCFHSDLIIDFAKVQCDIIRRICPNHFITHNCMDFSDLVDYYKLAEELDFVCQDQYPMGDWIDEKWRNHYRAGACLDLVRSFKKKPIWIMEQQAGTIGWGTTSRLPKPGQLSQMAMQSIAHGADCVVFFRWRNCAFGTEQYWDGILPVSGIPNRRYEELKMMIVKMEPIMEEIQGAMPHNEVAIQYSYRQQYAFRTHPHNELLNYQNQILKYYRHIAQKQIGIDFVNEKDSLNQYKLVIAPLKYLVSQQDATIFEDYVQQGGVLVLTMLSGVKDEFNICDSVNERPGLLSKLCGITIPEYDNIAKETVPTKGVDGKATVWADLIQPDADTESLAQYDGRFYQGTTAVSMHCYGKGKCIYIGCEPDEKLLNGIMDIAFKEANIEHSYCNDEDIEICSRIKNNIKYTFVINCCDKNKKIPVIDGRLIYGDDVEELGPFETHIYKKVCQ